MRDLLLPVSYGNRLKYPWLLILVRQEGKAPYHMLGHGKNYAKYAAKPFMEIKGHVLEKADAIRICQEANDQLSGKKRPRRGHQLSTAKDSIDLSGLGKPKEKKPMLILPKDFKKD